MFRIHPLLTFGFVSAMMSLIIVGGVAATAVEFTSPSRPLTTPTTHSHRSLLSQQATQFMAYLPMVMVPSEDAVQPTATPTETTPTPTATTSPGGPLPNDVVGTWYSGTLFTQDLYDPTTGHWASPNGLGQMYRFGADASYTYMGFLHIQNGNCVTDVSVYKHGVVRTATSPMTLVPSIAKTRTYTACGQNKETITEGPFEPYQINWQVAYDDGGRLKLYVPEGEQATEYYKDGMAPALIGGWSLNGVHSTDFYNPRTGQWATPTRDGAWFRFAPDGTYRFGEYGHGQDKQGCATTYWVYQEGTIKVSGGQFSYQATSGRTRLENACQPGQVRDEAYVDPLLYEFTWEIRDRLTVPKLAVSPMGRFQYIIFDRE
jgi:hypothetical protein